MEFIYIDDEKMYPNEKYLVRAYGNSNGKMIGTYELIKNNCIDTKKYCFVEKKTNFYVLGWDLDFKDNIDECYLENHEKITQYIINKINEVIDDITMNADKNYVYAESTNGLGKHIYYIFLIVDKKLHLKIRDLVFEKIKKDKKYNSDILDKIIDKSTCDANGIRLFGCVKNNGYYYPVKEKSTYNISGDIDTDFKYCLLNTNATKYNFNLKLELEESQENIRNTDNTSNHSNNISIKNYILPIKNNSITVNTNYNEVKELLEIIQHKNKEYDDWIKVGLSLHTISNSNEMKELWYNWSVKNYDWKPKQFNNIEEEINRKWNSFKDVEKPLTLGTIRNMAKNTNQELYSEWFNKYNKKPIVNLIKDFDQQTVAIYFNNAKPTSYIYKKGEWYVLMENNLWRQMYKNENSKLINDITETVKDDLIELKNMLKPEDELLKLIPTVSKKLGTSKFILGVIDFLREKYRNDSVQFDTKSNLFGFNNIVYDLEINEFRKYKKEDMVSITTGFDWIEPKKEEIELIEKIICQIQTDKVIRDFYLDIFCSGLWGTTLQNYIIFNGCGSNGKSMINDLMLSAFGNYGHVINSIILCEQRKQGANTEISNMNRKRLIISREPPNKQGVKLSNSILKELTGSNKISARKIYSDDENTYLCMTLILECNKKPLLEEEPTEGDTRRIIDLFFGSKFVNSSDKHMVNNTNIFEKNLSFVQEEFREKHKFALLKILFEHNKIHYKNKLIIPKVVEERTLKYFESSIEILEWFNQVYEKVDNYTEHDYVKISDINEELKVSEYYNSLEKKEKRKLTREKLIAFFKENPIYKNYFSEETDTCINNIRFKAPIRIKGHKKKELNLD